MELKLPEVMLPVLELLLPFVELWFEGEIKYIVISAIKITAVRMVLSIISGEVLLVFFSE